MSSVERVCSPEPDDVIVHSIERAAEPDVMSGKSNGSATSITSDGDILDDVNSSDSSHDNSSDSSNDNSNEKNGESEEPHGEAST